MVAPQFLQNLLPAWFSAPHNGQIMGARLIVLGIGCPSTTSNMISDNVLYKADIQPRPTMKTPTTIARISTAGSGSKYLMPKGPSTILTSPKKKAAIITPKPIMVKTIDQSRVFIAPLNALPHEIKEVKPYFSVVIEYKRPNYSMIYGNTPPSRSMAPYQDAAV